MEAVAFVWDLFLHLDVHLSALLQQYGVWVYGLLFVILFCETGLVVTPFLPGDSLLFVAGTLWATSGMNMNALVAVLVCAVLLGDNCNYWIGRYLGPKVFRREQSRLFNRAALDKTRAFYERHGGKTVIIARYLPLVRTFAPFVAGIGRMVYLRFLSFSFAGALLWVLSLTFAGYFFGNIPLVRQNLTMAIFAIIAVSLAPLAFEALRSRLRKA